MSTRNKVIRISALAVLIMAAGLVQGAAAGVYAYHHPARHLSRGTGNLEVVIEGGMAIPAGNVSDPLDFNGVGKDAGNGYELGFRVRQYTNSGLAIAPAFHYVEFGKTSGVGDFAEGANLGYEVKTSLMSYGVDAQYFMGTRGGQGLMPYATAGIAMIHNRYHDVLVGYGPYDTSVNAPGINLGAGLRASNFELSACYTFDRFMTDQMASAAGRLHYNWDYLSVRFGLAFGGR